jgi:hypothetical protein
VTEQEHAIELAKQLEELSASGEESCLPPTDAELSAKALRRLGKPTVAERLAHWVARLMARHSDKPDRGADRQRYAAVTLGEGVWIEHDGVRVVLKTRDPHALRH